MDAGATGIDGMSSESQRNGTGSFESDIEVSQSSLDDPFANRRSARNLRIFHPCISLLGNSRLFFANPNENVGISVSCITASSGSNSDRREMCSQIISRLIRHPWTESTEFTELWSDIPTEPASNGTHSVGQEESTALRDGPSVSDKAESTERPGQCSDKPNEFKANRNSPDDGEQLIYQNVLSINGTEIQTDKSDSEPCLISASGIFRQAWTESTEFIELWSDIPNEQNRNRNPSRCRENNKNAFCRAFSGFHQIVLFIVLSLASVSAIYMGGFYNGFCPANEIVTNLVYIIGISGIFYSFCRVFSHFKRDMRPELRKAAEIIRFISIILIMIEIGIFCSMTSSFKVSENYCNKSFFKYTLYMNFAAAGIVFLSVLHYYEACIHREANETL